MRRDERRQVAAEEARSVNEDPVDVAEVRAEVYRLPARGTGHEHQLAERRTLSPATSSRRLIECLTEPAGFLTLHERQR